MYTDELQCKRASVTNGMANPAVDVISLGRFFSQEIRFPVLPRSTYYSFLRLETVYDSRTDPETWLTENTFCQSPSRSPSGKKKNLQE